MKQYKKILVPVDGSKQSYDAVQVAETFAKLSDALIIMLVVENYDYEKSLDKQKDLNDIDHEVLIEASKLLTDGVGYKMKVAIGNPKHTITKYAKESNSDLIVIGATGSGSLGERLIGTTAAHVVNYAPCNVFVVK